MKGPNTGTNIGANRSSPSSAEVVAPMSESPYAMARNAALNTGPMKPTDCAMTSISVSLGTFIDRKEPGARELLRAVRDAVDHAYAKGKLFVTVAGNQHLDLREVRAVAMPTESGQAIGVYATDVLGYRIGVAPYGGTDYVIVEWPTAVKAKQATEITA